MEITDSPAASACLERIGYYRLSGYWYPFRRISFVNDPSTKRIVDNDFRPGTTFQQVMELYTFDKRLRLLMLDAIERVEVAFRVDTALLLGAKDAWAHRNPDHLHGNFAIRIDPATGRTRHQEWLDRVDAGYRKSNEEFVKHYRNKYQGNPPIWIAIELWDFGTLSFILAGMQFSDQLELARKHGLPRTELLTSWARSINHVRNICAHHSRLWNRSPADQASPPKVGEISALDHIATDANAQARIYLTVAALQFLLKTINPTTTWRDRLKSHLNSFPKGNGVDISQAGFPKGWEAQDLWS
jgi:abortive infection bacteriophage resistance protein